MRPLRTSCTFSHTPRAETSKHPPGICRGTGINHLRSTVDPFTECEQRPPHAPTDSNPRSWSHRTTHTLHSPWVSARCHRDRRRDCQKVSLRNVLSPPLESPQVTPMHRSSTTCLILQNLTCQQLKLIVKRSVRKWCTNEGTADCHNHSKALGLLGCR